MKTILITVVLAACAAVEGTAMPTKEETERAEPVVRKLMAPERAALESGKKTRTEVAAAAMKLADEADTEAAKLLLMKGAFVLYVRDGNLEKAVETMNALEKTIADVPPQCVTNMIETALLGVSRKEDGARLYRLLDAAKENVVEASPPPHDGEDVQQTHKGRTTVQSIIDGMIEVPGDSFWLSETELTQGQWEAVMGNNPAKHKGVNLPVENVSREDCDAFLEKLNQTKEVRASQFEFCLPGRVEWAGAARAGSGVAVSNLLDIAWLKDNSDGQTHAVATKAPNAWGFYDMVGNVSEQVIERPGDGCERGYSFMTASSSCSPGMFHSIARNRREACYGLRVAAHIRPEFVKWTYEVVDGALVLGGKGKLAVQKSLSGALVIPATIDGKPVRVIGDKAFEYCGGLTSVTIPEGVTSIGNGAFGGCGRLTAVTLPSSLVSIGDAAFCWSARLKSVTIPESVKSVGANAFQRCGFTTITFPSSVTNIAEKAIWRCGGITSVTLLGERPDAPGNAISECGNLKAIHVPANAKSWAGMKEWQGIPLVFDAEAAPTVVSLAQICNTNGLVHCWRFNGSLKDEIGGSEAKLEDGAKLENGYVSKRGKSNIDLGGQMLPAVDNLTIELWVKANKVHDWDRLFVFGSDYNNRLTALWSWWGKSSLEAIYNGNGMGQGLAPHFGTFAAGVEYHVALVIEQAGKHYKATTYRQNAQTGEILSSGSMLIESGWSPRAFVHKDSWLGKLYGGECNSDVCYNEVRIWNRALGEKELTQNAIKFHEAGETMKDLDSNTMVNGVKWVYEDRKDGIVLGGEWKLAVPTNTTGALIIPAAIDGKPVREIGFGAFKNCVGLTSVTIPEGVKTIWAHAFCGCSGLESVDIPMGVTHIDAQAFDGCRSLKSLTLPPSVKVIGGYAFRNCRGLASVTIPSSVKSVERAAFYGCSGIVSLTISPGVTSIGWDAFYGCNVTSVAIPYSVTDIGICSFAACVGLKSIAVDLNNPSYSSRDGLLCTKDGSRLVAGVDGNAAIPSVVTSIERGAYFNMKGIESVVIPAGVTNIGFQAFNGAGLKTVTISSSVANIEDYAFSGCDELSSVTMCGECPHSGKDVFGNCRKLTAIHVPAKAKSWAGMKTWQGIPLVFDAKLQDAKDRTTVQSILDGMIKVPGRDYWLSETELTQGQWEAVMGYNLSAHKGANLPVENVSRDDCDVFLEKLNQTKEVQSSQFEFRLPELQEWKYAAWAGSGGHGSWIKPGVVGNVLDMAWLSENSSNQTHAVAAKSPNAFGFYDMLGNVWEWLDGEVQDSRWKERGAVKGCHYKQPADRCNWNQNFYPPKLHRSGDIGLRLAAHVRSAVEKQRKEQAVKEAGKPVAGAKPKVAKGEDTETVGDYTWSYSIRNGGASIEAPGGRYECAVSPSPEGELVIPAKLGGVAVTRIGRGAFSRCHALTSVTIPSTVTSIGMSAFYECRMSSVTIPPSVKEIGDLAFYHTGLKSVTIPEGVVSIGRKAFEHCWSMESVSIPSTVTNIGRSAFAVSNVRMKSIVVSPKNQRFAVYDGLLCTKDGKTVLAGVGGEVKIPKGVTCIDDEAFYQCDGLTSVAIPSTVVKIGNAAFEWCDNIEMFSVVSENREFAAINGLLCTKDGRTLIAGVNGNVVIPEGVTNIIESAFTGRRGLRSVTIPSSMKAIGTEAFRCCKGLMSVTMCGERPSVRNGVFDYCEKLKAIHVPANAKSWAGMKEWQGIPLVFDGKDAAASSKVDMPTQEKISVAQKLESCDFLLNKDVKKNAKYYLCLFSASWCGPCRREMPRIAKMYAETLKADPDIELIHFSRDQDDEKALAWAKEHDVKFPVVKPKGGNPLNLQSRGIPHLFIVKADGTLVEEGHPAKLFTEEKLSELK